MDVNKSMIQLEIENEITLGTKRHQTTERCAGRDHTAWAEIYGMCDVTVLR